MASDDSGGVLFLLAVAGGLFLYSDSDWSNSIWYSIQYKVGFADVLTENKPKDCVFIQAPLGLKGCSYTAQVRTYNADNVLVGGDNAPQYGKDTNTDKPVISYDGGKNWNWYNGTNVPDPKAKSVKVYWTKVSS